MARAWPRCVHDCDIIIVYFVHVKFGLKFIILSCNIIYYYIFIFRSVSGLHHRNQQKMLAAELQQKLKS